MSKVLYTYFPETKEQRSYCFRFVISMDRFFCTITLANLRGCQGRTPPPPRGPNSFIFMQFSAKNLQNNPNLGIGAPAPFGKILDLPLHYTECKYLYILAFCDKEKPFVLHNPCISRVFHEHTKLAYIRFSEVYN